MRKKLADIPVGKQISGDPNDLTTHDYSHVLPTKLRDQGYQLHVVHARPLRPGESHGLHSVLYHPEGPGVWNLSTTNSSFSNNIWWRGDGDFSSNNLFNIEDGNYNFTEWIKLEQVFNDFVDDARINNPIGIDFPRDFQLNSNSPAIDAGDWLTKTTGEGFSTSWINLEDNNYFFKGIPSLEIPGDNIFVGSDTNLEVIDFNYFNKSIKVNRTIDYIDNEIVSLSYYNGKKPDIGAMEFSSDRLIVSTSDIGLSGVESISFYIIIALCLSFFIFVIITRKFYIRIINN